MDYRCYRSVIIAQGLLVASCTTIGPTLLVSPPAGKTQAAFADDRKACMATTDTALQPVATRMNLSASSTADIAAGNSNIQAMYNDRYGQCMSARGNVVSAPTGQPAPTPGSDPAPAQTLTRTTEITDPASIEAEQSLAPLIGKMRRDCDGEDIAVGVRNAELSSGMTSRLVALSEPNGSCFGQPGENDYLLERRSTGWALLLAAEPGSISVLATIRGGHADVEMHSLGLCVYRYGWNGSRYTVVGAQDCSLPAPRGTDTPTNLMRP